MTAPTIGRRLRQRFAHRGGWWFCTCSRTPHRRLHAVARLEGGRVSPSFATLRRYAEATGTRLTVGLVQADTVE